MDFDYKLFQINLNRKNGISPAGRPRVQQIIIDKNLWHESLGDLSEPSSSKYSDIKILIYHKNSPGNQNKVNQIQISLKSHESEP
jgi:hypothetical protein